MSAKPQLRPQIFKNLGGMSRVVETPLDLKFNTEVGSPLPYYSYCEIRVSVPPTEQLSRYQPILVKRLNSDWNGGLSNLNCSTGNFRWALNEGKVSMGHVWAEIYSLSLDQVSSDLGFGHIHFTESFEHTVLEEEYMEYFIRLFYSEPFPAEFGGLEYLITGYLNAAIVNDPFPIQDRLKDFVRYRSLGTPNLSRERQRWWAKFIRSLCGGRKK